MCMVLLQGTTASNPGSVLDAAVPPAPLTLGDWSRVVRFEIGLPNPINIDSLLRGTQMLQESLGRDFANYRPLWLKGGMVLRGLHHLVVGSLNEKLDAPKVAHAPKAPRRKHV